MSLRWKITWEMSMFSQNHQQQHSDRDSEEMRTIQSIQRSCRWACDLTASTFGHELHEVAIALPDTVQNGELCCRSEVFESKYLKIFGIIYH